MQPYIALGEALRDQGHAVTVTTGRGFDDMIEAHGLAAASVSIDYREIVQSPEVRAALNSFRGKIKVFGAFKEHARQQLRDMWRIAKDVRPELIVYHPKGDAARHIAEALQVPAIPTSLQPLFVPTGDFPCVVMPFRNLGRTLNRQTHNFVNWITGKVQGTLQGAWRENDLGLSGAPSHAFFEG